MADSASTPPDATPAPSSVDLYQGRYELGPVLGRGGTCTVNRAWDTRLQRFVAIKRLLPPLSEDEHARARFNREGRAIARLSHPNLVVLIDRGSTDAEEYLVFEYVEGRSLKELVRAAGPLQVQDACHIAGQVAEGLAQAHLAGIVHRDVKPQNILLDAEGRAKLTDFGIATGADWTKVTRAGTIVGSSRYMAPEQVLSRPVDARSDIYSLGIVFYEMLSGAPPFDGTSITDIGRQHVKEKPPPLSERRPGLSPELERVVHRCLEKLPENRFQSMDELLGALVALGYHSLERAPGGLLEGLRRRALSIKEHATDPNLWVPPPGSEVPPPAGEGHPPGPRRVDRLRERRQPRHARRRLLQGGLALGVVALVLLAWLMLGTGVTTPSLVGKTLDEAQALAASAGVRLEVASEQIPSDKPGVVQEQEPAAGEAPLDGAVTVRVTRPYQPVKVVNLDDSDPDGDQEERSDLLPRLTDGDVESAWSTELYKSGDLQKLKPGVGFVFELESPAALLIISSPDEGWKGELQIRREDGSFAKAADLTGQTEQRVALDPPLSAGRIWITSLVPGENERFRVRISGLAFAR